MPKLDIRLVHKGCGGEPYADDDDPFRYESKREDGSIEYLPRIKCSRCMVELGGPARLVFAGRHAYLFNDCNIP